MFVFLIMILTAFLVAGIVMLINDSYSSTGGTLAAIGGLPLVVIGIIFFFGCLKWDPSNDTLTGFIYQRNEKHGYAHYSLRFSQNAGMDEQPSFCAKAGSDEDKELSKYVGTDTKVEISEPARALTFDSFWSCTSYATVQRVIGEGEKQ